MAIYTVHQPPLRNGETSPNPEDFVFVRDGVYVWGFVFGPVWMAWRGLWLVLLLYLVGLSALAATMWLLRVNVALQTTASFLIAFLTGLEASSLQRWTLKRRGYKPVGVVVGDDLESAERRFFSTWAQSRAPDKPGSRLQPSSLPLRMRDNSPDILGLFPRPDSSR